MNFEGLRFIVRFITKCRETRLAADGNGLTVCISGISSLKTTAGPDGGAVVNTACSPLVSIGFLWELRFPPTV